MVWANGVKSLGLVNFMRNRVTFCTNHFPVPKKGRHKAWNWCQRWVLTNGTRISPWNVSSGKQDYLFRCSIYFSTGFCGNFFADGKQPWLKSRLWKTTNVNFFHVTNFSLYVSFTVHFSYTLQCTITEERISFVLTGNFVTISGYNDVHVTITFFQWTKAHCFMSNATTDTVSRLCLHVHQIVI